METHDFSKVRSGDKVTHLIHGRGEVYEYTFNEMIVHFENGNKIVFDKGPNIIPIGLYHGHVEFRIDVLTPAPAYKEAQIIAIRNSESEEWMLGRFICHDPDGKVSCLMSDRSIKAWKIHTSVIDYINIPPVPDKDPYTPGEVIAVKDQIKDTWTLRIFESMSENNMVICKRMDESQISYSWLFHKKLSDFNK